MGKLEIRNDRTVLSTENNGYAGSERDENLIEEDLVDTEIPVDDRIPDGTKSSRTTVPSTTRRATGTIRASDPTLPGIKKGHPLLGGCPCSDRTGIVI